MVPLSVRGMWHPVYSSCMQDSLTNIETRMIEQTCEPMGRESAVVTPLRSIVMAHAVLQMLDGFNFEPLPTATSCGARDIIS